MSERPYPAPPPPILQNPIAGTTIDTYPETLGLASSTLTDGNKSDDSHKSPKSVIQKAVDKLSRSKSHGKAQERDKHSTSMTSGPKRIFSLKGKSRAAAHESRRNSIPEQHRAESTASSPNLDDSPFIRPPSPLTPPPTSNDNDNTNTIKPSNAPSRPSLQNVSGAGSMFAGTQTLIQALQAVPWDQDPEEGSDIGDIDSGSDSGAATAAPGPLSSSIHTIHRPVARAKRGDSLLTTPMPSQKPSVRIPEYFTGQDAYDSSPSETDGDIEDEIEDGLDFDTSTPNTPGTSEMPTMSRPDHVRGPVKRTTMSRAGSLATVRLMRRARLAEKLREVFELTEVNEVVAELPCWLLRSVLLQGYMYLTTTHLCFFAHMPSREDQILKSGSLQKKTNRTKRWIKHWFVLKNDALSWYQSSSDPYFPRGVVDLRYAISCEPSETKGFRIRTNQKTITLSADSTPSREEWVKAIRKVIFKAQNMGESVKISIPYSIIVDVEKSTAMDFSETIEVKVVDKEDNSIDSYFFAYFHEMDHALEQIRKVVQAGRVEGDPENHDTVRDTTIHRPFLTPSSSAPAAPSSPPTRVRSMPPTETSKGGTTTLFKIPSFLKSLSSTDAQSSGQPVSLPPDIRPHEEFTHVGAPPTQERAASSPVPLTRSVDQSQGSGSQVLSIPSTSSHLSTASDHTYPPSPSPPHLQPILSNEGSNTNWTVPVPSWLKSPSRRIFTSSSSRHPEQTGDSDHNAITEVVTASPQSTGDIQGDFGFSVLDPQSAGQDRIDHEDIEKFRHTFALDEREELLGCIPGYLFRVLPVPGRFYISNNLLCFRASQPISKTKMMIPLHDVLATEKSKAFRFSHHGLIVIIKGHEELFFEFSSLDRRRLFMELLNSQLEDVRRRSASGEPVSPSGAEKDAMVLEDLEPADLLGIAEPRPPPETMTESTPAVMFTSTSSTFITFKPEESLQFTLLTIGSRGDVQPYIALAKGLIAEGHKVRIATHGEFKEWIEGNDIEFTYVGGDPAELMRICVENGTFTVAFLREGLSKFRGWIDDLLQTSWDACQNTDVLIESPSAMSGIHIAEALQIPYFRAFTMPWTRTRAYPHAFAVPDRKMGGGYNYMTYVMFDQVFWRGTAGQINRWRKNVLGLAPTNLDKLEQHKVPFLYNFSPTVVPQPLDWYEWIRVTGYWFLDDADVSAKKWTPPTDLIEFIDEARQKNKKIVYIGFGSIVVSDPDAMTRCVVEAIVESGVYAILSKGWSDRLHAKKDLPGSPEAPLPPQIYKISSVPHDWLFQRIDAACHHGGAGTTGASLKAGIPTIIKPFFGDQFFWADRVEALGIGSSVRKLTVASLTAALLSATTDRKQIDRAKIIGQAIRSENGVKTAIECIYRDLEYAKSLIKKPTGDSADEDATISDKRASTPYSHISPERIMEHSVGSPGSSRGPGNAPSEDWSVISDEEDAKSVRSRGRPSSKRASMITKPFQVLQDVLSLS